MKQITTAERNRRDEAHAAAALDRSRHHPNEGDRQRERAARQAAKA